MFSVFRPRPPTTSRRSDELSGAMVRRERVRRLLAVFLVMEPQRAIAGKVAPKSVELDEHVGRGPGHGVADRSIDAGFRAAEQRARLGRAGKAGRIGESMRVSGGGAAGQAQGTRHLLQGAWSDAISGRSPAVHKLMVSRLRIGREVKSDVDADAHDAGLPLARA